MALVHCYIAHHTHGQKNGGGARAARYLERDGEYTALDATNVTAYNQRTSDRTKDYGDLTYRNVANLPSWAQDNPQIFFETAYRNEGKNRRWGTSMQTNFPRQFSHDHQVAMLNAFVETHLPNRPTLFVIHEPGASDGLPQPHTHILWSERLMHDGKPERGPEVMFKRPEAGGAWKYASGKGDRHEMYRLREAWCASVNLMVDREGYGPESLMDPRSFQARGITRQSRHVERETNALQGMEHPRPPDDRTPDDRQREQQMAIDWWAQYKRTMGLTTAMDPMQALQIIAREVREPGARTRAVGKSREEEPKDLTQRWAQPLIGNKNSRIYHTPTHKNYGDVHPKNQVRFWTEQSAQDAGYRRAKNDHYGRGTGHAMAEEPGQRQRKIEGAKQGQPGKRQGFLVLLTGAKSVIDQDAGGGSLRVQLYRDKEQRHGIGW